MYRNKQILTMRKKSELVCGGVQPSVFTYPYLPFFIKSVHGRMNAYLDMFSGLFVWVWVKNNRSVCRLDLFSSLLVVACSASVAGLNQFLTKCHSLSGLSANNSFAVRCCLSAVARFQFK